MDHILQNNIYKFTELQYGTILLEKINLDPHNYTISNDDGNLLLTPIKTELINNLSQINNYDFKKSNIIECNINNVTIQKLKYKSILEHIYELIGDGTAIIKNTKLNIKTLQKTDNGFYYLNSLGISVQGVDSNKCIYEIIHQSIENEFELYMKIILNSSVTVEISF